VAAWPYTGVEGEEEDPMKNILVGNLDFGATEGSIRKLFEKYGRVEDVRLAVDRESGESRGFAFVEMGSDADAERATAQTEAQLKGVKLQGPALTVNEGLGPKGAYPRQSRSPRELRSKSPASVAASASGSVRERQPARSKVTVTGTEAHTVDLDGIVSVTGRAIEVFGAREKAIRWLRTPLPSLSNRTPLSMLKTSDGIEQIEDVLGRIEQGVW
jgi:RNA recognition motif-containing protein